MMETLAWLPVPGDIVFALGGVSLAVYAIKLLRRPPRSEVGTTGVMQAG